MKPARITYYLNTFHDDRRNLYLAVPLTILEDFNIWDELHYDLVTNSRSYSTVKYDVGHGSMAFLRYNFDEPEKCDFTRFLTHAAMNFCKVVINDSVYPEIDPKTGSIDHLRYNRELVFQAGVGDAIIGWQQRRPMHRWTRAKYWCAETRTFVPFHKTPEPDYILDKESEA